jgi:hypothetical protein
MAEIYQQRLLPWLARLPMIAAMSPVGCFLRYGVNQCKKRRALARRLRNAQDPAVLEK